MVVVEVEAQVVATTTATTMLRARLSETIRADDSEPDESEPDNVEKPSLDAKVRVVGVVGRRRSTINRVHRRQRGQQNRQQNRHRHLVGGRHADNCLPVHAELCSTMLAAVDFVYEDYCEWLLMWLVLFDGEHPSHSGANGCSWRKLLVGLTCLQAQPCTDRAGDRTVAAATD